MPAAPIGSVWAAGSWSDTAWEAGTWADASAPPAPTGQSPRATRYRMGYAVQTIHGLLMLLRLAWP